MYRGTALALIVLAGCDQLFNLQYVSPVAPVDAMADSFDIALCPPAYDLLLVGSRYRVIAASRTPATHHDECHLHAPGMTHLAVIDSFAERDALQTELDRRQAFRWYVGAIQQRPATNVDEAWIWLTGAPVDPLQWNAIEPNDLDNVEADHNEQFAVLEQTKTGLIDLAGNNAHHAICECDGRAITTEAMAAIDVNRN